jgi:hypothetical protein
MLYLLGKKYVFADQTTKNIRIFKVRKFADLRFAELTCRSSSFTTCPLIFSKVSASSSSKKVPPTVARNTLLASGGKLGKHQLSNLQQKLKN